MATTLASNRAARDAILARVKKALGKSGDRARRAPRRRRYMGAHAQGPRPAMPADLVGKFLQRATDMQSTVERIAARTEIPGAVARYLDALVLPPALAAQQSRAGVCWPEFADLDWTSAGLAIEPRPTQGHDRIGITGTFCAIAETGTLVVLSGAETPTATALLPDTHIAIVRPDRIVSGMEEAFDLVRRERGADAARDEHDLRDRRAPATSSRRSSSARTDPFRVHILVVG